MLEQLVLMLLGVEPFNGWKIFPEEFPKLGQWVLVSEDPGKDDGVRAYFTGYDGASRPIFMDDYGNPCGAELCFWKEIY
jgi:hypothetical protein